MLKYKGNNSDITKFNGKYVKTVRVNGTVVWTKNTEPETWLLNSDLRNTIGDSDTFSDIKFTADGVLFNSIRVNISGAEKLLKYDEITPYSTATNKWASNGYRTLKFSIPPTGKLRTWLQNNGTKQ